jgi:hypothetical protein
MEKKEDVLGGGVIVLDIMKAAKLKKAHISMPFSAPGT